MAARIRLFNFLDARSERDDDRLAPRRLEKLDEISRCEPRRAGVDERMKVQALATHHSRVQYDRHASFEVVDGAERRDRARPNPPDFLQEIGGTERDPPLR